MGPRKLRLSDFQTIGTCMWKGCQTYTPAAFNLLLIYIRGWSYTRTLVGQDGLRQRKIPMTPSRIEPTAFQLIAQCLNQLRHRMLILWWHDASFLYSLSSECIDVYTFYKSSWCCKIRWKKEQNEIFTGACGSSETIVTTCYFEYRCNIGYFLLTLRSGSICCDCDSLCELWVTTA